MCWVQLAALTEFPFVESFCRMYRKQLKTSTGQDPLSQDQDPDQSELKSKNISTSQDQDKTKIHTS